jgi:hypothetical protein
VLYRHMVLQHSVVDVPGCQLRAQSVPRIIILCHACEVDCVGHIPSQVQITHSILGSMLEVVRDEFCVSVCQFWLDRIIFFDIV